MRIFSIKLNMKLFNHRYTIHFVYYLTKIYTKLIWTLLAPFKKIRKIVEEIQSKFCIIFSIISNLELVYWKSNAFSIIWTKSRRNFPFQLKSGIFSTEANLELVHNRNIVKSFPFLYKFNVNPIIKFFPV